MFAASRPSNLASFTDRWSSGPPYQDIDPRHWDEFEIDLEAEDILTEAEMDFRQTVIRTASIIHCEVVRIHPFINGNGRTARMCISYILARAGFPPVPFETDRSAYYAANALWLDHQDIQGFQQLLNRALSFRS